MDGGQALQVTTEVRGAVLESAKELAARKVRTLLRLAPEPVLFARVKLAMAADPAVPRPATAEVSLDLNGRPIYAHAAAGTMREAIERMSDRLRIRLQRAARNWAAARGSKPPALSRGWRHQSIPARRVPYFPRPPGERTVISHTSYAQTRQTPAEALADLELLEYDFHLFTERFSGQDSVIYRTDHGYRLAQGRPKLGRAGPAGEITVSRRRAPRLSVAGAVARLEALGQPFLFFINGETSRGNLIYHRYDGHYGLIKPLAS